MVSQKLDQHEIFLPGAGPVLNRDGWKRLQVDGTPFAHRQRSFQALQEVMARGVAVSGLKAYAFPGGRGDELWLHRKPVSESMRTGRTGEDSGQEAWEGGAGGSGERKGGFKGKGGESEAGSDECTPSRGFDVQGEEKRFAPSDQGLGS